MSPCETIAPIDANDVTTGYSTNYYCPRLQATCKTPNSGSGIEIERSSVMLKRQDAILVQKHALTAIQELSELLSYADGKCSDAELSRIKKAVGLSIGEIQVGILDIVSASCPDLDDLV